MEAIITFYHRTHRYCPKTKVVNGLTIPKGAVIAIPIGLIQRNPLYWKDPEKFDPERWVYNGLLDRWVWLSQLTQQL